MEHSNPSQLLRKLVANIGQVFIGKDDVIQKAVITLLGQGHLLLEDLPGLGKTLLAKAIAKSISGTFKRIQFTADLLPSDVTGMTVFSPEDRSFAFRPGPIFTNILLADEINRATPRTQSSLLEAMEEQSVTVDGQLHALEQPFFVIATQNPVELEGTYPLPFAQMDRFMTRLSIGYMAREMEMTMLKLKQKEDLLRKLPAVVDCQEFAKLQQAVTGVHVEEALLGYIVDLVRATRANAGVEFGASPRGTLDVQRFAQAIALFNDRSFVLPDDIKTAALNVLPHRLIARKRAQWSTAQSVEIIEQILSQVAVPI